SRSRVASKNQIAALEQRPCASEAQCGEKVAQAGNRNHLVAADIDPADKSQVGLHQLSDATLRRGVLTCSQICSCSSRSSSSSVVEVESCRYAWRSRSAAEKSLRW